MAKRDILGWTGSDYEALIQTASNLRIPPDWLASVLYAESGMSTSVTNMGGFLAGALLQPLVGWIMDRRWDGTMAGGVRLYDSADYRWGLLVVALAAWIGAAATWYVRETGCRNVWRDGSGERSR